METRLLNHYKLPTLDPSEWPADKDSDESSEEEDFVKRQNTRKSRYSALNRNATLRGSVPGAERGKDGLDSLVQKDEPDPLGGPQSVMQILRRRGMQVQDDPKTRNRFLLSSTTFSPALFLSQVHNEASTESLLRGLDFLSQSIEKKSASLKVLVESNFERFVRAKSTIDNVYKEMRDHGQDMERPTSPRPPSRSHSRQISRSSLHFRKTSGGQRPFSPNLTVDTRFNPKRKNALIKESEYGVQPIKQPLQELSAKAEEVWGPALGGREKEESLKAVLACVEKHRALFELPSLIREAIKRRDHDTLVEKYKESKEHAVKAKSIVEVAVEQRVPLKDADIHRIIVTARMWADVDEQIDSFKRDVWRRLAGTHLSKHMAGEGNKAEEHMELIGILLELGVEDNPITIWLLSRYDFLRSKIEATFERMKVEVEILRRKLGNREKPTTKQLACYLRAANADGRLVNTEGIDSPKVIKVWEHILTMLKAILSTQGGILGEVVEFWETAQGFIDGRTQRTLPVGIDGASRKHHRLSTDSMNDLTAGAVGLISKIRDELRSFFSEPPPDDLSMLLSPISPSPITPATPVTSTALSPRNVFDPSSIPPPSPRRGDSWEKYGFWPPYATSTSGSHYLGKFLTLIGTAACELAALSLIKSNRNHMDDLKRMLGEVRERCLSATLAAWTTDSENCKLLEDWTRSQERPDLTNMPSRFRNFQGFLLTHLQQIMYISEASKRPDAPEVVVPPSSKLLSGVRSQFVTSIYRALRGMVQNAENPDHALDGWESGVDGLTVQNYKANSVDGVSSHLDAQSKTVRILITLSNVQNLRNDVVPHLINQFETNFSVQLTDEQKSINDALSKIDLDLFRFYTEPISKKLDRIIKDGITSPDWVTSAPRPQDARPYVYTVLLELVLVHTEVSTTASPLTSPILKHLLEQISLSLIAAFKQRSSSTGSLYTLPALMQATLDVEFLAQTMNNYTTDKASETQSAIYVTLDERTDNDARMKLQGELQEMRGALKRLRERTRTEFACFKRMRKETVREPRGAPAAGAAPA